ncbi:hypothetical protein Cni_G21027 [Canna indica]|uniref:Membralin n=1 Tax=Canna indica TaxID=4628 RepID=A0AAQ3QGT8_9LILI|nr:hypothetical protein Cni_G21027 [Canna indica]
MDPEQTFLRVHARLSGMLSQLLTPRIRMALEYTYLAFAVAIFGLLVVMHTNFVQQPGCSSEFAGVEFGEAQLVQIKITGAGLWAQRSAEQNIVDLQRGVLTESLAGPEITADGFTVLSTKFWSNWLGSGARRSKLIFKSWKNDKELLGPQVEKTSEASISKTIQHEADSKTDLEVLQIGHSMSIKELIKAEVLDLCNMLKKLMNSVSQLWKHARWYSLLDLLERLRLLRLEHLKSFTVQWLENRSKAFEPTYLYTTEKGYFLLPEGAKSRHNIRTVNVTISAQSSCFGNRWQQLLINSFVGYDTILVNSLLNSPGHGYLYNFQTKEFYDLSYGQEASDGPTRFGDYFVTKCGVLIMSLFVFFTTTMSVSFTLRETQSRMLRFTVQLQHHARNHLPTFQLIFVHVIESLVFVPIMIGILFFLFEFYDDQLLAFLVLTLVWLCELFTMISVRTTISMQFFPRFFLLYFLVFHIYFFSYPYGFSYLAFSATAAFMQHLILYFWNRFEVPALQRFIRTRAQLQQQTGVQITSSTIYTSTLHIARLSMPNRNAVDNEISTGAETSARSNISGGTDPLGALGNIEPREVSNLNSHQTTAPGTSLLNSLGSLLLWILGGASSEGILSYFSIFRDPQNQGQVYGEQTPQGNQPLT